MKTEPCVFSKDPLTGYAAESNASTCRFVVPGVPVSKGRPRMARTGIVYTPKRTAVYENLVRLAFHETCPHGAPADPYWVELDLVAWFPIPKSWPKWRRGLCQLVPQPKAQHPDIDNILKSVLDGLNGVAFADDRLVCQVTAAKFFGGRPRLEVGIVWHELTTKQSK